MNRAIPRAHALQTTPGQCQSCGRRDLVVVLVTEQDGGFGRDGNRKFYTCEQEKLMRYLVHECPQVRPQSETETGR